MKRRKARRPSKVKSARGGRKTPKEGKPARSSSLTTRIVPVAGDYAGEQQKSVAITEGTLSLSEPLPEEKKT
jgi:hypothetical protein